MSRIKTVLVGLIYQGSAELNSFMFMNIPFAFSSSGLFPSVAATANHLPPPPLTPTNPIFSFTASLNFLIGGLWSDPTLASST